MARGRCRAAVNSSTTKPIACSSLRRCASRRRSRAVQWHRWPITSATTVAAPRSRRPGIVRVAAEHAWRPRAPRRPARATSRRNRRSSSEWPTGRPAPWRAGARRAVPGPRTRSEPPAEERLRRPAVPDGAPDGRRQLARGRRRRQVDDRAGAARHAERSMPTTSIGVEPRAWCAGGRPAAARAAGPWHGSRPVGPAANPSKPSRRAAGGARRRRRPGRQQRREGTPVPGQLVTGDRRARRRHSLTRAPAADAPCDLR